MTYIFPSDEWTAAFKDQINTSPAYKESGATWEAGDVCFVVKANPAIGLTEDQYIYLKLYHGECQEAKAAPADEAASAGFVISANYDRWKQLFRGELDPVRAMMMGQISIKGNLGVLMKYMKAAKDLLECGGQVSSTFLGE
ncbi:MAG: SCP2 sterol-binding domain-containing protein [Acidobacteria bacterium]|nr:SCP2 sterol-binding domain-containing protein [Acidobacteriota bacterium]